MTEPGDVEEGRVGSVGNNDPTQLPFDAALSAIQENQEHDARSLRNVPRKSDDNGDAHRGPYTLASPSSQSEYSDSIAPAISMENSFTNGESNMEDAEEDGRKVQFPHDSSNRGMIRARGRHNVGKASGRDSDARQHVSIRQTEACVAMDERTRRRHRWKKNLSISKWIGKSESESDEEDGVKVSMHGRLMVQPSKRILKDCGADSADPGRMTAIEEDDEDEKKRAEAQYRLTTVKRKKNRKMNIPGMYEDLATGEVTECCWVCPCQGLNSDRAMSAFLHWSFRSPFVVVFGTAAIGWLAMTFVFALLIFILGWYSPSCIGGPEYADSPAKFMDAYQLSWTTFSTVGYGLIYPSTSANHKEIHECTLITILTTFESFVGVLFSSLCAALMFAKVARVQSFAQVTFSDPIVIRYGTGLAANDSPEDDDDDDEDGLGKSAESKKSKDPMGLRIPCPVLEFRIFNRLSSLHGGEIIDATLNMVAVIDVSQADPALMARNTRRKKGKKKRGAARQKKSNALRYQRDPIEPLHEHDEEHGMTDESAEAGIPERSPPSSPPVSPTSSLPHEPQECTIPIPKPNAALRYRSVADRDDKIPHRGPAPSLAGQSASKQPEEGPGDLQYRRSHIDPRVAVQRTAMDPRVAARRAQFQAQHASMAGGAFPPTAPGRFHASLARFTNRTRQDSNGTGSIFFQPFQPSPVNHLNHVSMRQNHFNFNQAFEEDPSGKIIPKKMLSKLEVESPDHPFFRRIWLVRHTLDVNSLLLKPHVRDMLRRNQGFWPKELNNYESIRASLEFDQILVSLSGTSNADANSVYAQHVYHPWDVNVGYRFVNALYRDSGVLQVDQNLINDVMEQQGGGGEPLQHMDELNFQDIMVL